MGLKKSLPPQGQGQYPYRPFEAKWVPYMQESIKNKIIHQFGNFLKTFLRKTHDNLDIKPRSETFWAGQVTESALSARVRCEHAPLAVDWGGGGGFKWGGGGGRETRAVTRPLVASKWCCSSFDSSVCFCCFFVMEGSHFVIIVVSSWRVYFSILSSMELSCFCHRFVIDLDVYFHVFLMFCRFLRRSSNTLKFDDPYKGFACFGPFGMQCVGVFSSLFPHRFFSNC